MKFNRLSFITSGILLAGMLGNISCRKADRPEEPETIKTTFVEEKFFNSHRSTNPKEKMKKNIL